MGDLSPCSATTRPEGRPRVWVIVCLIGASHLSPPPAPTPRGLAIRVNQVGYLPDAPKVAVACALEPRVITSFGVVDERNRRVFGPRAADAAGAFGPCVATYPLHLSSPRRPGAFWVVGPNVTSPPGRGRAGVHSGAAEL